MELTTIYSTLGSIVLAVITLRFFASVAAQTTTPDGFAVCLAGWEWSYNSEGQNPCQIAGALQAPCLGYSAWVLEPINNTLYYTPPGPNDTLGKKCECNTVIYTLYQACSLCQWPPNSKALTWVFWEQYCSDGVYVGQYPFSIPFNTSVPHWAYLNDTTGIGFDPTLAQAAGRDPEATPLAPPTLSLSSSSTHSLPTSTTITPTPTPSSTSGGGGSGNDNSGGSKANNVGAITGGVIGGVVALASLTLLGLFILKRRGEQQRAGANNILAPDPGAYSPTTAEFKYEQPRPYDPSDPSTFPSYVPSLVSGGDSLPGGYASSPLHPVRYSGVPEL